VNQGIVTLEQNPGCMKHIFIIVDHEYPTGFLDWRLSFGC
jgi:hypothetical protein